MFLVVIAFTMLGFLIIGGVWWIVLWSFNFPIAFAWKQVIGVVSISALMNITTITQTT
jgi:hypothetical protein